LPDDVSAARETRVSETPPGEPIVSRQGPGRLLIGIYTVFAVAACARATWQIATDFDAAPLAYSLSALAGLIYLVAAIGIARPDNTSHVVAAVSCAVELAGVLAVGGFSLIRPDLFPEATVWSHFGEGYGYVPLILPVLGLLWLRKVRRSTAGERD